MVDRLRINGNAIIEENENTGDVTVDVNAINTERAFNTSIGDGVDYLNPLWIAHSEWAYYETPQSFFGNKVYTGGSGSTSTPNDSSYARLSTGTTQGSKAVTFTRRRLNNQMSWSFDNRLSFMVVADFGSSSGKRSIVLGFVDAGNYTQPHVGIQVDGSDLVVTSSDGSSVDTTTLETNYTGGQSVFWVDFYPQDRVDVYQSSRDTPIGTHTSTLPSGDFDSGSGDTIFAILAENPGTATDVSIRYTKFRAVMLP